ncbi:isopenicillin N synthase family dioxygenase [Streptomyces clavuligerus]|uniref:Isopenicillin N synthase n=2 Tax=Streptomyces clavuligerus TaxID=1901 RepID=IPNS_STRCL|nr:2OG-Fe(II) oxygenase family protein [Streptomyces clavuligerus]P10621.1 RecName: Full=Isopenicillin N synthase; Short=IPNS [Streptomyces clavuligerus]AAA26770.1 isopenicillin N synthetase [Streptomyces clavuligerus]ANW18133.1 penicillin synthase [Streptomyces clavuligerus]AXU12695.1 isopenicillin N synthase family oxygenase [Streptomyces clavuligerus]EDY47119.1 isopenicillin N synthetase [Streptomyces clavuligerus]MBY6302597.1 isopenicillin N synthase family oxygenase [Streptomyces clavuli
MPVLMPSAHVPTIDISPLFGTDAAAKKRVAEEIHGACRGSGFFYATNHGVDVQQLQDVVNEFHGAMTDQEKHDLAIHAYNPDNPHVRNGYYKAVPGRKAVESFCYLNPDFGEDHPMIAAGTPMHEVNLWPDEERHPRFRPFCEGYYRQMLKLSTVLMRGLALALGRPEHFFDAALAEQDSLSSVSLIRYPYLEEYPPVKTGPDGQLLSFEDHLDVSMITVLFQTQVQNLQVETVDGWRDIPTSENDFLVNCGTYMAHVTNDYFPAPNHRVKFVNAERLSLPFFLNGGHEAVIEPFVPEGASEEVRNEALSYGDYLQHGLRALIVKNGQT